MFIFIWFLAFVFIIFSLFFKAIGNMSWTQVLVTGVIIGLLVGLYKYLVVVESISKIIKLVPKIPFRD